MSPRPRCRPAPGSASATPRTGSARSMPAASMRRAPAPRASCWPSAISRISWCSGWRTAGSAPTASACARRWKPRRVAPEYPEPFRIPACPRPALPRAPLGRPGAAAAVPDPRLARRLRHLPAPGRAPARPLAGADAGLARLRLQRVAAGRLLVLRLRRRPGSDPRPLLAAAAGAARRPQHGRAGGGPLHQLAHPLRPRKLVCLDGIGLPDMPVQRAPQRLRKWLDDLQQLPAVKTYDSFEQLAGRVRKQHPQLSPGQALFIARCWGHEDARGRIRLCADPKHILAGPLL